MTESVENGSAHAGLVKKIIRQVEFYFSDYNLMKDTFMRDTIKEDDGWFTMDVMLKFKRLSQLCSEPTTILEAVKSSDRGLMEVDIENQRMRRKPSRPIPEDNEEYRTGLKARTVHVNGFQDEEDIDAITEFLSEYGRIDGVSLQRTHDKKFKGSVFATFMKQEDAEKFLQAPMVYYKSNELTKMLKSDYFKQQDMEKEKRGSRKKRKDEETKERRDDLEGTFAIKVSGITDDTVLHMDVKRVFENHDVHTIRFFDRLEKHGSEGYLIFQDERAPEDLLKILDEKDGKRTVTIKSAEVEFSVPNEEETKLYQQSYIEARQNLFGQRKKGKFHQRNQNRGKKRTPKKQGKKTTFGSDDENQDGGGGKQDGGESAAAEEPPAKQAKTE